MEDLGFNRQDFASFGKLIAFCIKNIIAKAIEHRAPPRWFLTT
jgi:hypothetical protein